MPTHTGVNHSAANRSAIITMHGMHLSGLAGVHANDLTEVTCYDVSPHYKFLSTSMALIASQI